MAPAAQRSPRATLVVLLLCGALTVAAVAALVVGVSEPDLPSPVPVVLDAPKPARPEPTAPQTVDASAFVPGPGGLSVADVAPGSGDAVVALGTTVVLDYVAWQGTRIVGSSYTRPTPARVPLAPDSQGWLAALTGVRAGGVRQVEVPPEREGAVGVLVEATVHAVLVPPTPVDVPPEGRNTLPSGITWADLTVGTGDPATAGAQVSFDYAVFAPDGTELDSSWRRAAPLRVRLGVDPLVFGDVIDGMAAGGRRQAWVPPEVAFPQGTPPDGIPAGQTLVLVVELREQQGKPAH